MIGRKINWHALQSSLCPKCNSPLVFDEKIARCSMSQDVVPCTFFITVERMGVLCSKMNKEAIDKIPYRQMSESTLAKSECHFCGSRHFKDEPCEGFDIAG